MRPYAILCRVINFLRLVVGAHLNPKAIETLNAMAKEADLFAEARGGVFSCVTKGHSESKPESKPSGMPEIKGGIC